MAVIEFDILLEDFEALRVRFDGDDAFEFSGGAFLHGVVSDIGAEFDDGHIVGEEGA